MASDIDSVKTEPQLSIELLESVQDRVLWLAMQLVHHANNIRKNPDGTKVGGHQASSASIVTLMTSLYFDFMNNQDRISVKPHGSPVFHAIQYLLGNLDSSYLTELRAYHGLQAYPSRTKDPDLVDFSTGSVGLGPVAPNFASIVRSYNNSHNHGDNLKGRYISIVGDAELDEGSVWEAIAEPAMQDASDILWVVDLNRQSLDRIIPGIRVGAWRDMFVANGWHVVEAKYGALLEDAFRLPNGEMLREAIDRMSNQVYQRLLRVNSEELRSWLPAYTAYPEEMKKFISGWNDEELSRLFHNLGGHDLSTLRKAFQETDKTDEPSVVFAYTLKGYRLPSVGDPQNHSVTLSDSQMEELRENLNIEPGNIWGGFDSESEESQFLKSTSEKLRRIDVVTPPPKENIPRDFGRRYSGYMSTQQIFGLVLTDMSRSLGDLSRRIVTVSPDVASSTNLGGWINRVGVWKLNETETLPEEGIVRALKWEESKSGQHIELGISENNLFMMLGQLGLSNEMNGEMLFPIGTLYDPFIRRGLDAFVYSVYSGAKFIVVGTPSGLSLAPEGGAHQSMMTASIGVEMPQLDAYEPCFGQELEWIMLSALHQIRKRGQSTYLRLTSKPVDQNLLQLPTEASQIESLRLQVLRGAYCLRDRTSDFSSSVNGSGITIVSVGAMIPEACEASDLLLEEGVLANVINVTGPGPLYRHYRDLVKESIEKGYGLSEGLATLLPGHIDGVPILTLADAHPHSLSWVGGAVGSKTVSLGVDDWGQSGSREDLYREYGTDVETIVNAALSALEL